MERYIPSKSSYNTYHAYKRHSMPNIRQKRVWNFGQRSTTSSENTPEVKYTGPIANALGFTHKKRVLRFIARTKPINRGLGQLQAQDTPESNPKEPQYSPSKSQVKTLFPHTVLDAPGLRNDFYSNLISWSGSSGKVAVGLGSQVYLWSEPEGAVLLPVTKNESISVVSFSSLDWLVVGTKRGTISLYSQESGTILAEFTLLDNAICCICWVPDSNVGFYLGDETGLVYYFAIEIYGDEYKLELATSFKSHQQQICGEYVPVSFWAELTCRNGYLQRR